MISDKRVNETEMAEILRIVGNNKIQGVKIEWEKAEEIAVMLNEVNRMNQFKWLKDNGELIDLNSWINTLRFHHVAISSLAKHPKRDESTVPTETTQEDIDRSTREMNAVESLNRGDIDGAFRSLDYFRDR